MPAAKPRTIDEYIGGCPDDVQAALQALRQVVKEEAPAAQEAIKYGMPTFTLGGNLVYFAAWKKHIALYPVTPAMEAELTELADFDTSGKGTVRFPYDRPLPLPLIRRIVQFRIKDLGAG